MADTTDAAQQAASRLEEELREALESLQHVEREIPALSRDEDDEGGVPSNHMADQGTDVYEMERLTAYRADLNDRIESIRAAQERLAQGTYGTCQRCGRQIAPDRLEAIPWAAYCIDCQEIIDRGEEGI